VREGVIVAESVSSDPKVWLRRYRPAPAAPIMLVCFPHAGGSAGFYLPLAAALSPAVDVFSVQYPGRQDRLAEPCLDDIGVLADHVVTALRPQVDRPVALFGHSMGALLAFEVARRLAVDPAVDLVRLFVSGRQAPSIYRDPAKAVHLRDDDGLVAELRLMRATDTQVLDDDDLLGMVLPAIRADYRAVETYRAAPGSVVRCPITALVGVADQYVPVADARRWAEHTTGGFDFREFPGDHFYLVEQHADVTTLLADRLTG
jgi:surfactin synthase thioesterase subunit